MSDFESPDGRLWRLCRRAVSDCGQDPDLIDRIEVTDPKEGRVIIYMRAKAERVVFTVSMDKP